MAYVRDAELYRAGYITFQSYLKERWGFSFGWANRLISSSDIVKSLADTLLPPTSVAVAEELTPLPTGLRKQIWDQAIASTTRTTGGRPNPTAEEVHKLVNAKLAAASGARTIGAKAAPAFTPRRSCARQGAKRSYVGREPSCPAGADQEGRRRRTLGTG